ncbi:MAG: hypothetical protein R3D78_08605 [Paracoccaceae bacterium]|jgi:hypothetical protein
MKKLALFAAFLPSAALAHADHSHEALTTEHMMASPFHIVLTLAAVVGVGVVARILWREARAERDRSQRK